MRASVRAVQYVVDEKGEDEEGGLALGISLSHHEEIEVVYPWVIQWYQKYKHCLPL